VFPTVFEVVYFLTMPLMKMAGWRMRYRKTLQYQLMASLYEYSV